MTSEQIVKRQYPQAVAKDFEGHFYVLVVGTWDDMIGHGDTPEAAWLSAVDNTRYWREAQPF